MEIDVTSLAKMAIGELVMTNTVLNEKLRIITAERDALKAKYEPEEKKE